jgi:hypothetical protein
MQRLEAILDSSLFNEHLQGGFWSVDKDILSMSKSEYRDFFNYNENFEVEKEAQADIKFKFIYKENHDSALPILN